MGWRQSGTGGRCGGLGGYVPGEFRDVCVSASVRVGEKGGLG